MHKRTNHKGVVDSITNQRWVDENNSASSCVDGGIGWYFCSIGCMYSARLISQSWVSAFSATHNFWAVHHNLTWFGKHNPHFTFPPSLFLLPDTSFFQASSLQQTFLPSSLLLLFNKPTPFYPHYSKRQSQPPPLGAPLSPSCDRHL